MEKAKAPATAQAEFHSISPQFTVPDVVATAKYYVDVLGFVNLGFFGDPPVFGIVARGPIEIFFNQDPSCAGKPRVRAKVAYDAYIDMSGVDALAQELRNRGARIVEGPCDRIYGRRELVIEDCNQLRIAFGEE
jgi:hypothetical protein